MHPLVAALLVAAVIGTAAVLGLLWRRSQGRARGVAPDAVALAVDDLPGVASLGTRATLLQFSTVYCSSCPATRRLLGSIADQHDGLEHREVDLTDRGDLARRFRILQTPTTFVLDSAGRVTSRIGGPPRRDELAAVLDPLLHPERQHA